MKQRKIEPKNRPITVLKKNGDVLRVDTVVNFSGVKIESKRTRLVEATRKPAEPRFIFGV